MGGSLRGIVGKVYDCDILVSKFEPRSCYYIHFWTNTQGKSKKALISSAMG